VKAGWELKALEKCLSPFKVKAKIPRKQFKSEGPFPIVSQEADFVNGYWDDEGDVCEVSSPVVIFGDHTQVLKYVDFDFVVGADCVKVLNPQNFLNSKFLQYFIEANPFPSLGYARHFRHVKSLPIPLPPLDEQKRIVAVLDAAFEGLTRARTHVQTNLQNARELFDRIANYQLLNDESAVPVTLGDVATIPSSLVDPRLPEFLELPHVGAGNMETGRDVLVDVKTSREERLKSGKYTFDASMVLYSKIRPYLRKVGRPDFEGLLGFKHQVQRLI
jgi:type I restriction enzyme S subunit